MIRRHPPSDRLAAYAEGLLSAAAGRRVARHLRRCGDCRAVVEGERRVLEQLSRLPRLEPPPHFVEAVMERVARRRAYAPAAPVPWRRVAALAAALASASVAVMAVGLAQLLGRPGAGQVALDRVLHYGVVGTLDIGSAALRLAGRLLEPAYVLVGALAKTLLEVSAVAAESGWAVQSLVLVLTVTLNYAFTRMVLSYQRRQGRQPGRWMP